MKKNHKRTIITALAFFTVLSLFADQNISFSGEVQTQWGVAAPRPYSDTSAGRFILGDTSFTGKIDAYYGNSSALAEGTVSYDAVTQSLNFSLSELWVDYTSSFWGLRIGRQKTAWGKADGIDITNVICPSDTSSFSAITSESSKLAIDSVRLSFSGEQFTADAYWIPFFTPASLPLSEKSPLKEYVVPSQVDSFPVSIGSLKKPQTAIWNGEYGLKLSGYFSALDVSLYGFYGWDDIPLLDYTLVFDSSISPTIPTAIEISGEYQRFAMFGADAAIPISETVLRAEAAFYPQRHFQKSRSNIIEENAILGDAETSVQRNELSALVGLDWLPSEWTFTAQYFCDVVFGDLESLEREKTYTHGATLNVSKSLLNETLEVSLFGLVNFNDLDSFIRPSVSYSISDQISVSTGAYIFVPGPSRDGEYGKYKDLSTIYLKAKFSF